MDIITMKDLDWPEIGEIKEITLSREVYVWNDLEYSLDGPTNKDIANPYGEKHVSTLRKLPVGATIRLRNGDDYGLVIYNGKFVGKY